MTVRAPALSSRSRPVSLSIDGEQLLAHCALMTDRSLAADFIDTVLPEAREPGQRHGVRRLGALTILWGVIVLWLQ